MALSIVVGCKASGSSRDAKGTGGAPLTDSGAGGAGAAGGGGASTGAGTGGGPDPGGATGGTPGSGGAAGAVATGGSAGAAGGAAGGAGSSGGTHSCDGSPLGQPALNSCRSGDECGLLGPVICCLSQPCWPASDCPFPPSMCGPQANRFQCVTDADCAPGGSCVSTIEGCPQCEVRRCHNPPPPCTMTPDNCAPDGRCQADGSCAPLSCDDGFTCLDAYRCHPGSPRADGHGCEMIPCDDGWSCGLDSRCTAPQQAGSHGCTALACTADGDCDCGYCVNGRCSASLGFCSRPPE